MNIHGVCRSCRSRLVRGEQRRWPLLGSLRLADSISNLPLPLQLLREWSSGQPHASESQQDGPASVGRYSRKPVLQAKELLKMLVDDEPADAGQERHPAFAPPWSSPLVSLIKEIVKVKSEQRDDDIMWAQLQKLAQLMQSVENKRLPYGFRSLLDESRAFTMRQTKQWLEHVRTEACTEDHSKSPPAPSDILFVVQSTGLPTSLLRAETLWLIATKLLEYQTLHGDLADEHVGELYKVWHQIVAQPGGAEEYSLSDWSFLPTESTVQPTTATCPLRRALRRVQPKIPEHGWTYFPGITLLTVDMIKTQTTPGSDRFEPLIKFLGSAVSTGLTIKRPLCLHMMLQDSQGSVRQRYEQIVQRYNVATTMEDEEPGNEELGADRAPVTERKISKTGGDSFANVSSGSGLTSVHSSSKLVELGLKNLSRAVEQKKMMIADDVLERVLQFTQKKPDVDLGNKIYESIMLTYFCLQSPEKALGVWRTFIQAGRKPTVATYATLMRGAQYVRDIKGSERFWQNMRQSKLQPDARSWGLRIWGLLNSGHVQRGLEALVEMSSEWLKAARAAYAPRPKPSKKTGVATPPPKTDMATLVAAYPGDVNGVPRPNQIMMNSAVAALARKNHGREHIAKVLSWGRAFGIQPDSITYNSLLNLCLGTGETAEALAILDRMREQGADVNSTTWTVLLTNLVEDGTLDDLSAEEQQTRVMQFIYSIESSSEQGIDSKGYATVLDRLLKTYNNPDAARAVFEHMAKRGLQPTTHIYTIYVTSLFQRKPSPNFAAIESLWSHIQAQDGGRGAILDHIFYDRMIEGHAAHHRTFGLQPTLEFLDRLLGTGRKPSWPAMIAIVRAMTERQDWTRLNNLINDVVEWEEKAGPTGIHVGEREYNRKEFYKTVLATEQMGNNLEQSLREKVHGLQK